MSADYFQRLDACTDYETLVSHCFGKVRRSGTELWLDCPYDPTDSDDKFSVDALTGKWKNHKTGDGGAMVTLLRKMYDNEWRNKWAAACPNASSILFDGNKSSSTGKAENPVVSRDAQSSSAPASGGGPGEKREERSFSEKYEYFKRRTTPPDLIPFAEAYKVDVAWLVAAGFAVSRGGKWGDDPRIVIPGYNPVSGEMVGHKNRWLAETETHPKSTNSKGSKAGIIGFDAQNRLPVLIVEGEKDWIAAAHDLRESHHVVTNTNGASTWRPEWCGAFSGRDVVVCYDADKPGEDGARRVCSMLRTYAKTLRVVSLGTPESDVFDWLRKDGLPGKDGLLAKIAEAREFAKAADYKQAERDIRVACEDDEAEPKDIANLAFRMMSDFGAMFFHIDEQEAFVSWNKRVYPVNVRNPHWAILLSELTGEDVGGARGHRIAQHINNLALALGKPVEESSWHAIRPDALYLAANGPEQAILKITVDGISVVANGTDDVVLLPNPQAAKIEYLDGPSYDSVEAEKAWNECWDCLNTDLGQRKMVECAFLAMPFYPFCDTHPLLRFQGSTGSGKSFAGKIMTALIHGREENQGGDTMAALYRLAGSRMMICLDNLERENFERSPDMRDLMLRAASGMSRTKSGKDSERETRVQRVSCWIVMNGKTPIGTGYEDMEERMVVIDMGGHEKSGFGGKSRIEEIKRKRTLILNYWIRRVQKMYADIKNGAMQKALSKMNPGFRPRLHEWYALLSVAMGQRDGLDPHVAEWMKGDSEGEQESIFEGDPIITLMLYMNGFLSVDWAGKEMKELVKPIDRGNVIEFNIHGQLLHILLARVARATNNPYGCKDARTLGYRIRSLARVSTKFGVSIHADKNPSSVPGMPAERGRRFSIIIDKATMQVAAQNIKMRERQPGEDDDLPI